MRDLQAFPADVVAIIFSYLPHAKIQQLQTLCKLFWVAARKKPLWAEQLKTLPVQFRPEQVNHPVNFFKAYKSYVKSLEAEFDLYATLNSRANSNFMDWVAGDAVLAKFFKEQFNAFPIVELRNQLQLWDLTIRCANQRFPLYLSHPLTMLKHSYKETNQDWYNLSYHVKQLDHLLNNVNEVLLEHVLNHMVDVHTYEVDFGEILFTRVSEAVVLRNVEFLAKIRSLSMNNQKYIPSQQLHHLLSYLPNCTRLFLEDSQLKTFPPSIITLTKLAELSLKNNQISDIPEEINKLSNLTHLQLETNQLRLLPLSLASLNLQQLKLGNNPLTALTAAMMDKLESLNISPAKLFADNFFVHNNPLYYKNLIIHLVLLVGTESWLGLLPAGLSNKLLQTSYAFYLRRIKQSVQACDALPQLEGVKAEAYFRGYQARTNTGLVGNIASLQIYLHPNEFLTGLHDGMNNLDYTAQNPAPERTFIIKRLNVRKAQDMSEGTAPEAKRRRVEKN